MINKKSIEITPSSLLKITKSFVKEADLTLEKINNGELDDNTTVAIRLGSHILTWKPELKDNEVSNY